MVNATMDNYTYIYQEGVDFALIVREGPCRKSFDAKFEHYKYKTTQVIYS